MPDSQAGAARLEQSSQGTQMRLKTTQILRCGFAGHFAAHSASKAPRRPQTSDRRRGGKRESPLVVWAKPGRLLFGSAGGSRGEWESRLPEYDHPNLRAQSTEIAKNCQVGFAKKYKISGSRCPMRLDVVVSLRDSPSPRSVPKTPFSLVAQGLNRVQTRSARRRPHAKYQSNRN